MPSYDDGVFMEFYHSSRLKRPGVEVAGEYRSILCKSEYYLNLYRLMHGSAPDGCKLE